MSEAPSEAELAAMTRWLSVVGFEGFYEVSDEGQARSVDRVIEQRCGRNGALGARSLKGQPLIPNAAGYVGLSKGPGSKRKLVHLSVLVLEAFVGPRPPGHWARHWDDDRSHNALTNLLWGTPGENAEDAIRNGRDYHVSLEKDGRGHLLVEPNLTNRRGPTGRWRGCLACNRARPYVRAHPEQTMQAVSDQYYRRIMESTVHNRE